MEAVIYDESKADYALVQLAVCQSCVLRLKAVCCASCRACNLLRQRKIYRSLNHLTGKIEELELWHPVLHNNP